MTNIKVLLHETHKIKSQIPDSASSVPSASLEKEKWKLFDDNLVYVRQCPFLMRKTCFIWAEEEEGGGGGGGREGEKKKKKKKKGVEDEEEEEEKKKKKMKRRSRRRRRRKRRKKEEEE